MKDGAVVASQVGLLKRHVVAITLELLLYPGSTTVMGLAIHGARSEGTLGGTEGIGRVGIELNSDSRNCYLLALLGGTTTKCHQQESKVIYSIHNEISFYLFI
jgi:hypothetical protein